jgi:hypothetical protein
MILTRKDLDAVRGQWLAQHSAVTARSAGDAQIAAPCEHVTHELLGIGTNDANVDQRVLREQARRRLSDRDRGRERSGGLTLYVDKGELVYEHNMMIIERYITRSHGKIAPWKRRIEVATTIAKPGAPAQVMLTVDGVEVARDYFDRRAFRFDGVIDSVDVQLR